jgi:hypothetical protein
MATEIFQINPEIFSFQEYSPQETSLITSVEVNTYLNTGSYIESFIYSLNSTLIDANYNFKNYNVLNNGQSPGINNDVVTININVEEYVDSIQGGPGSGQYITYFNFLQKEIGSNLQELYISEISFDRTEVRLDSTSLTTLDILEQASNLIQKRENSPYFLDFYLNFGENQLAIANNIQLDNQDPSNPTILIKLYEALPEEFDINSTLWVVTLIEESIAYQVNFLEDPIFVIDTIPLNGPNFNISIKDQINNSTVSLSYLDLVNTSLTSSQLQLNSLLEEKEIDINIDYSKFSNFVHFSSAETRLQNFYDKIVLLEQYNSSITTLNSTSINTSTSSSLTYYNGLINNIIQNFDSYEYYLYYSSGSVTYPKTTLEPPYLLYSTTSSQALTWLGSTNEASPYYGGLILSASIFDNENKDNLLFTIPEYLRDDPQNQPYELFVEMVAQHYDNIWIYYKDVTEKYNADNRLEYGVSKDIVADAIRDFGIKLYQNNFSNEDLYTAFLGLTPEGSLFPFPNITGSLPTPSGFEYVDTLISASNDYIPLDDVNKSLYKRIYHNLPYLLKSKGTLPGLRALITSYGIPDTVLRINEFGGKDKSNINDWDYWEDTFNYAFSTTGSNYIKATWAPINPLWDTIDGVADSISLRFRTNGLPFNTSSIEFQSLWNIDGTRSHLVLRYEGTGYTSGSYAGSTPDPYNQYAYLDFYPSYTNDPSISASIYLPFFDGGWWSVMVNRSGTNFTLSSGNKIYEGGNNGTSLGFYTSSSVIADDVEWVSYGDSYFAKGGVIINGNTYTDFSGSLQEIRYFTSPLSENVFKDYIMNPYSIEGNSLNSSPNELIFRAPLGGELYTGSVSIHPKVTGSWITTSSFVSDSNFLYYNTPTFVPNTEYFFSDQVAAGIKNAVSDKIRIENGVYPSGDTLSPFRSLAQNISISQSYTANTNLLEVAFSPQNEINQDIMNQIGYFNIGEFIGDPRERFTPNQSYPALNKFRDEYFQKYIKNYDLNDFIRLIKFFDNSLFKMIKDFVPVRTSLASGIVIKQHLLERNKYPQPQVNNHSTIAYYKSNPYNTPIITQDISVSGTVAPQWNDYNPGTIENFSGGTGGTMDMFNGVDTSPYGPNGTGPENIFGITQSWNEGIITPLGIANTPHNSQDEFYDGEFSGSVLTVTTQSLFAPYPPLFESVPYRLVQYYSTSSVEANTFENNFLDPNTAPSNGEILFFNGQLPNINPPLFETKYLKIAKNDCNGADQSYPLGQATILKVFVPAVNSYASYTVSNITEYSTYYFYAANETEFFTGSLWPNQILNYYVTSSITTPRTLPLLNSQIIDSWEIESGDIINYFNTSSGIYTLGNTPNTRLFITASAETFGYLPSGSIGKMSLILLRNGSEISLDTQLYNLNGPDITYLSSSLYPIQQDQIYVRLTKGSFSAGTLDLYNAQFFITQSTPPVTSSCNPVIVEPYLVIPSYYNSDYNPLLNNVELERLNTFYQDVDYSTGITTPTNFDLIMSGSALKAAVQDSNYTTHRHILPRYNGSKSTSQLLNTWSPPNTILGYEDLGTYGKIPTVESLKTAVAYCEDIGGWPPERMEASAIFIKYLINSDGTVTLPNITENSLADVQNTFITNERVIFQSADMGSGTATQYRDIIRGGSRIEPILYNQVGQLPGGYFTSSIDLTDNGITGSVVNNYQAQLRPSSYIINTLNTSYSEVIYNTILSQGNSATFSPQIVSGFTSYRYKVSSGLVGEGSGLLLIAYMNLTDTNPQYGQTSKVNWRIVRLRNGVKTTLVSTPSWVVVGSISGQGGNLTTVNSVNSGSFVSIPYNDLVVDDELFVEMQWNGIGNVVIENNSKFVISQTVIPNSAVPSAGLWISSSGTTTSIIQSSLSSSANLIYTTSSTLVTNFGNPYVFGKDISGSGFDPIALPWSIEYGDEFRFEGWENRVFQVGKVDIISSSLIPGSPVLAVELNQPIPPSGSLNLNQFLIRRYIDDASQTIIKGFKPLNSTGPYIIKPEYVVPELNKSIDEFILDLTQKGLL